MSTYERFEMDPPMHDQTAATELAEPNTNWPIDGDMRVISVLTGIEAMGQARRPSAISEEAWHILLKDMRRFAEQWLDIAFACGWSINDLYGSPKSLTHTRRDLRGVALILNGRQIESIDNDRIVIANRLGPPNVFYRQPPGCSSPFERSSAVPVWEAI